MAVAVCIRFCIQHILNNVDSVPHGHDSWLYDVIGLNI